jgi:thymidylate synthase
MKNIGTSITEKTLGEVWLKLVENILKYGKVSYDEGRKRLALENIRVSSITNNYQDKILEKYANKRNIKEMVDLFFYKDKMYDIDIIPSFNPGPKSYAWRLKKGKLVEFVIKRLSLIPESKKAVIVFPIWEDYKQVLKNPRNDYLPCIVCIQFRLHKNKKYYLLNTTFYARSIDAFQKAPGNLVSISMLSHKVSEELSKKLKSKIKIGFLDGLIADAHIYQECINEAKELIKVVHDK